MATTGKVTEIRDGQMIILINQDDEVCHTCAIQAFCKHGECETIQLPEQKDISPGDIVSIEEQKGILLKTSLIAYGIPLLFFSAGILIASQIKTSFSAPELLWFGVGLFGLILGGFVGNWIAKKLAAHLKEHFIIKTITP